MVAGIVPVSFQLLPNVIGGIKSGQLRALAVTANKRLAALPEVPTAAEAGLKGFESAAWFGFLAPRGTPKAAIDLLNKEVVAAVADPAVRGRFTDFGAEPITSTPEEFAPLRLRRGRELARDHHPGRHHARIASRTRRPASRARVPAGSWSGTALDFVQPVKCSDGTTNSKFQTTIPVGDQTLQTLLDTQAGNHTLSYNQESSSASSFWLSILINVVPWLLFIGLIFLLIRRAGQGQQNIFNFGKSRAKLIMEDRPSTTFADVAGVDEAKSELRRGGRVPEDAAEVPAARRQDSQGRPAGWPSGNR